MFIRPCYRNKNGKRHAYWALVESYRTERGPRQRVASYLGQLPEQERLGVKQAAQGKKKEHCKQLHLFDNDNKPEPEWVEVDVANVTVDNELDFGGPWLALELIRKLELDKLFDSIMPEGKELVPWSRMALILMICRLCNPSSELYIAEHYYRSTAMADLLGVSSGMVYDERLYRALDKKVVREGLEVKMCKSPDGEAETFNLCRSEDRREQEKAMHQRFAM